MLETDHKKLQYYAALIGYREIGGPEGPSDSGSLWEAQKTFEKLTDSGIYYDEFLDILYPDNNRFSIKPALNKLGIKIPKIFQEALYGILKYHLTNIIEGSVTPFEGMISLSDDVGFPYDEWFEQKMSEIAHDVSDITREVCYLAYFTSSQPPNIVTSYKEGEPLENTILRISHAWLELNN